MDTRVHINSYRSENLSTLPLFIPISSATFSHVSCFSLYLWSLYIPPSCRIELGSFAQPRQTFHQSLLNLPPLWFLATARAYVHAQRRNSGRPRANFPRKILKETYCNNPVWSRNICEKNRNLDSNLRKKTNWDFSKTKFSILPAFCWFTFFFLRLPKKTFGACLKHRARCSECQS